VAFLPKSSPERGSLVSRIRSSQHYVASSYANFGSRRPMILVWFWFGFGEFAAKMKRTSDPPH
jgi:hypothetical protein